LLRIVRYQLADTLYQQSHVVAPDSLARSLMAR
jgi:hypothetical protein